MKKEKVVIDNLHKSFGKKQVLSGTSLKVNIGESMVIIGGSGTGKSVTLQCIIGLLKPDSGSVLVDGVEVSGLNDEALNTMRKKFGMLFQGGALFDSMCVWKNVGFALKHHTDMKESEIEELSVEKLKLVGLRDVGHLMPSELSGGMKKRVSLARAIAMDPEIMLYDEPTTGLDPIMADVINDLIISLRESINMTSVTITHDMVSAYKISDRIAMLYNGKIIETGTPEEIRNSGNEVIMQFINGRAKGPITDDLGYDD